VLLEGLLNPAEIRADAVEAIRSNASRMLAFSVFCQNLLIGVFVVSKTTNIDYYVSHFCVQDHIILSEHPKPFHSRIIHSVLNPLFAKSSRFVLKEILRQTNKTCLYLEVNSQTLVP